MQVPTNAVIITPRERLRREIGEIAQRHGVTFHDLLGRAIRPAVVAARHEAYEHLGKRPWSWSASRIALYFGRDVSTVRQHFSRRRRESLYANEQDASGFPSEDQTAGVA